MLKLFKFIGKTLYFLIKQIDLTGRLILGIMTTLALAISLSLFLGTPLMPSNETVSYLESSCNMPLAKAETFYTEHTYKAELMAQTDYQICPYPYKHKDAKTPFIFM